MSVLVLNANTAAPITVSVQTAGEGAPVEVGSVTQSFNFADRSSVRGVKRNYGSLTTYVDTATKDSIINLLKWGNQIPCSGDLLANIQTQATVRYTGCRMVPGLVSATATPLWEVGLSLNEVQPSITLLRYSPGDTITGEAFTRAGGGYYLNPSGFLLLNGTDAKRDAHYIAGVRSLLLEGPRTNDLLQASAFNNAAWVKTTMTITTGISDPTTGTGACTLTATGTNSTVEQNLSAGASAIRSSSVWLKRRTGTGIIDIAEPLAGVYQTVTLTASWQRFKITGASAGTVRTAGIRVRTSGDAIDAFIDQNEVGPFASSEIPTTTVAVPRASDFYSLPFTPPPGEMTLYVKFIEGGTILTSLARVVEITSAGEADPRFIIYNSGSFYSAFHANGTANVSSTLAVAPVIGDTVELLARMFGDGSVDITQSVNGAASTTGTQSAANSPATAWAAKLCWLNSGGTAGNAGFTAIQSFKIIAGARSLAELRAA